MKILLRRDQRSGMLGKVLFSLEVRADLTPEEKANVAKYKLGETMLYQSITVVKELLGHSSITTTMRYAHVAPSALRSAIAMLSPLAANDNFGQPAGNQEAG